MHEQFSQILFTIGENETPKPEAPTFAITTRLGVSTRDPPFPTPSEPTPANTEGAAKKEGPEGVELSITHNEEPVSQPSIFYQPSKSSNLPFPSRVKNYDPHAKGSQVDFVVLEMDEDKLVPIILGRPFLTTARAAEEEEEEDSNKVHAVSFYPRTEPVEPLEWKALENRLKPSCVEPPKLELKELPEHLEYAFLQENNQLPVVISSALSTAEKARLLEVLKNHKGAIA
ncbi:hypothetical protein Tco_0504920 [Tanacetum coccineum]